MLLFPSTAQTGFWGRLDPRLKILVCFGLVALTFAASRWQALTFIALVLFGLSLAAQLPWAAVARAWWRLRWLLLFTILLHLLFSPGEVLLGSRWLSYDGLLRGLFVASQISLALLAALLLSLTLSPEQLVGACGWFLAPLALFRFPVRSWQTQMLLVLKFIPRIQSAALVGPNLDGPGAPGGLKARVNRLADRLILVFDRLIDEAEILARRVAAGEEDLALEARPTGPLLSVTNSLVLLGGGAVTLAYLWLNMP